MKRHISFSHNKERDERTYKCPVPECDKAFDSAFNLERHSKCRHENPLKYKCDLCICVFQRKIKLKHHIIAVHTKEYPFHCEKCSKQFITENFFKKHVCKTYVCEVCNVHFEKWSQLCEHKKSSSDCNTYKHKCNECGKEFKLPSLLKDHQEMHRPEQEREGFPCTFEGCDKFYTMKKNLDAHYRRKHGDLKDAFKCTECGQILSTKKKLENHIKVIHSNPQVNIKKAGPRNQRKDAGKKKHVLEALTGLDIPNAVEKKILNGDDVVMDLTD